jgi:hypothetical protein
VAKVRYVVWRQSGNSHARCGLLAARRLTKGGEGLRAGTEGKYQKTLLDRRARREKVLSGIINTSTVAPSEVSQLTRSQGSDLNLSWGKGGSELSLGQVPLEVSQSTEESAKKLDDPGCARRWSPTASAMRK